MLNFSYHFLELLGSLLQGLLVENELLGDFGSALLRQNILELDVELLLFLDHHVFLVDLFGLGDQALLQTLDLLDELVRVDVRAFQFAPSVHIEWLFELILEELALLLILKDFLLK